MQKLRVKSTKRHSIEHLVDEFVTEITCLSSYIYFSNLINFLVLFVPFRANFSLDNFFWGWFADILRCLEFFVWEIWSFNDWCVRVWKGICLFDLWQSNYMLFSSIMEKNSILFTYPPEVRFYSPFPTTLGRPDPIYGLIYASSDDGSVLHDIDWRII